jgi:broad specificity phosphatase PhoE
MQPFTTLYLVRHAETYHNASLASPDGATSIDLSPRGVQQAEHLAAEICRRVASQPTRLYCSDQQRAIDTLEPTRQALGIPRAEVVTSRAYGEFYRGEIGVPVPDWTGWLTEYDRQLREWTERTGGHADDFKLPKGTSPNEEKRHTRSVLGELASRHLGQTVVLVAHGGFNEMALRELLELGRSPPQHNGCINVLTLDGGAHLVCENVMINFVAYLPDQLRPWEWVRDNRVPGVAPV